MKTFKVKLLVEEMETLNKMNGKEVEVIDDGEHKIILSYDGRNTDVGGKDGQ